MEVTGVGLWSALAGGCLVVVTFIPSVSPPTLIGAVQRSKQFQCATLVVSTGEMPAGISAARNCLYDNGVPGGVGQKNLVSFSRAGSFSGHSVGGGIRAICGRNGARDVRIPIPAGCGGGLEPPGDRALNSLPTLSRPVYTSSCPDPNRGRGPLRRGRLVPYWFLPWSTSKVSARKV